MSEKETLKTQLECCARLERMGIQPASYSRMDMMMTLEFASQETAIDFAGLAAARNSDFIHDMLGMWAHMDRQTCKLQNCFSPRYARAAAEKEAA